MNLYDNLNIIKEKIAKAALKSNRSKDAIKLIAVTKTIEVERIRELLSLGHKIIGESKVQETLLKQNFINRSEAEWHLIGHLQTNKVKQAVKIFDFIQSVDSKRLFDEIEKELEKQNIESYPILLEFNTSKEESKFGADIDKWEDFIEYISKNIKRARVKGLMTIGALTDDEKVIRKCFIDLRNIYEKIKEMKLDKFEMEELSMGMSGDFELAIEEGSTMVRIGTALFGERIYK